MITLSRGETMEDAVERCDRCFKTLTDGAHGVGLCPYEPRTLKLSIVTDDIPGGVTYENYGPTPITFYSHTERKRYMEAHGLTQKEKFCPTPGTDRDPAGVMNSRNYIDPQTLENARILVTRQRGDVEEAAGSNLIRGTFNIVGEKDAVAVAEGMDTKRMSRIGRRLKADASRNAVDPGRGETD